MVNSAYSNNSLVLCSPRGLAYTGSHCCSGTGEIEPSIQGSIQESWDVTCGVRPFPAQGEAGSSGCCQVMLLWGVVYGKSVPHFPSQFHCSWLGVEASSQNSDKENGVSMGDRRVQASYSILLKSLPVKLFNRCTLLFNFFSYCSLFYPHPSIWVQSLSQLKTALLFAKPHTESFQSLSQPHNDIWSC